MDNIKKVECQKVFKLVFYLNNQPYKGNIQERRMSKHHNAQIQETKEKKKKEKEEAVFQCTRMIASSLKIHGILTPRWMNVGGKKNCFAYQLFTFHSPKP